MIPFIDLSRALKPIQKDINRTIQSICRSGVFLNGPEVAAFEEEWAKYCGQTFCVACASGTDALMLLTVSDRRGCPWKIQANTTKFTAAGVRRVAPIIFSDVDAFGSLINPDCSIQVLLHGRTKHDHNQQYIDACQAHGWKPRNHQHAAWSFYPTKNLGCFGDAGAVTTNDHLKMMQMRAFAKTWHSRMSEIDAAVLRVKLPHLEEWNQDRARIAWQYYSRLDGIAEKNLRFSTLPGEQSNHHIFAIQTPRRDDLQQYLKGHDIQTQIHYRDSLSDLPGSNRWCAETLSLPCFPGLTSQEVNHICDCILVFFKC